MEREYQISWLKVIGVLVLFIVIIAIVTLLIPKNTSNAMMSNTTYINNINLMKEAGFEYFQGSNLPENVGSSNIISLSEMVDSKILVGFLDERGNSCNVSDSYVKVTKTLDNEYAMKVALNCDTKSDYIVTTIANKEYVVAKDNIVSMSDDNIVNPKSDEVSNSDDKPNNVTNNYYNYYGSSSSSNNSNTSTSNNQNYQGYTKPSASQITQIVNYNINYINSCLSSCVTNNCSNTCLNNIYYTVTFDTQGGTYVARQTVKQGEYATYQTTYKTGYKFLGWYYNGLEFDFNTPITEKITLVARWEKIQVVIPPKVDYTVTFDSNGGSYVGSQIISDGNLATRPSDPIRKCYEFVGWYYNGVKFNFNTPITKDITLVAKWVQDTTCNKYQVIFDSNGGSYVPTQDVQYGARATEPTAPTRSCYKFAGWYTDSSLTTRYNFGSIVTKNITLYAKWIEDISCNRYQINFNTNGGSYVPSQDVQYGDKVRDPGTPVKECYRFAGWYADSSLTSRYYFNNTVTSNMTLYAKWIDDGSCVVNHLVRFDSNGGSYVNSQTVRDGAYVSRPSTPIRSGYRFLGWYYNGLEFNFGKRIYADYTLVARWEKIETQYSTYCKLENRRYYSTSYVPANQSVWSSNWQIKFDNLRNIQDLKITNIGYITTTSMYEQLFNNLSNKGISSPTTSTKYEIPIPNVATLINTSLKSNNFNKDLSDPYYSGGYWYTNASIVIKNYNGVMAYTANNGYKIHPVPFYFDVSYTDLNSCVDDLTSNSYRYSNYKVTKTYYR